MDPEQIKALNQALGELVSLNKKKLIEEALQNRTRYLTVVLENIQKPHNASAVLRTVECMGLQDFHLIENGAAKDYEANPGIVKGAVKWVDVTSWGEAGMDNTFSCLQYLKNKGYALAVTSPHASGYTPEELPLNKPLALIFGNEQHGISPNALELADYHLKIPMWGFTESYNLSVSAAIAVYTLMQRIRSEKYNWQLSAEETEELRLQWYRKLVKRANIIEREFGRIHDQERS